MSQIRYYELWPFASGILILVGGALINAVDAHTSQARV